MYSRLQLKRNILVSADDIYKKETESADQFQNRIMRRISRFFLILKTICSIFPLLNKQTERNYSQMFSSINVLS